MLMMEPAAVVWLHVIQKQLTVSPKVKRQGKRCTGQQIIYCCLAIYNFVALHLVGIKA